MNRKFAIGTDIGGSHISCALIDMEQEIIVPGSFTRLDVDNKAQAGEILSVFSRALRRPIELAGRSRLAGIGFAMPGPFDYAAGIARFTPEVAKYENLYNVNVGARLKVMLDLDPACELRFMNDAACFAVGEAWTGLAAGHRRSVAVTLGTGFGSAFTDGGLPVIEGDEVPGDGCCWHLPYHHGIADDYFSTRWFVKHYGIKSGITCTGVKEIAERASTDPLAMEVFEVFGKNLGDFLGPWLQKFDAGILVIGGSIAGSFNLFGKYLEESLKKQNLRTQTGLSRLKDNAAITGSARLLDPDFWQRVKSLIK